MLILDPTKASLLSPRLLNAEPPVPSGTFPLTLIAFSIVSVPPVNMPSGPSPPQPPLLSKPTPTLRGYRLIHLPHPVLVSGSCAKASSEAGRTHESQPLLLHRHNCRRQRRRFHSIRFPLLRLPVLNASHHHPSLLDSLFSPPLRTYLLI